MTRPLDVNRVQTSRVHARHLLFECRADADEYQRCEVLQRRAVRLQEPPCVKNKGVGVDGRGRDARRGYARDGVDSATWLLGHGAQMEVLEI